MVNFILTDDGVVALLRVNFRASGRPLSRSHRQGKLLFVRFRLSDLTDLTIGHNEDSQR